MEGGSSSRTYLVTGDTGFLGQALVARLKADGHTARVAHSLPGRLGSFTTCGLGSSVEEWRAALEDCAGVFHLAWATVPSTANANPLASQNQRHWDCTPYGGSAATAAYFPHLCFLRRHSVWGDGNPSHPQKLILYDRKQLTACPRQRQEHYALLYRRQWGVDARIVRLSNPFGPGQNIRGQLGAASNLSARALRGKTIHIWGDGKCHSRLYLY